LLEIGNMVFLTRRERFSAAHKLFRTEWTEAQNLAVFGQCANPNWHGHNYELFVTVKSEVNAETGYGVNLKLLSQEIKKWIIDELDHRNLNLDVEFLSGKLTTTEVVAIAIFDRLKQPIAELGCHIHGVKLVETENNYVEYFG